MSTLLRGGTAVDERGETADAWLLLDGDTIAAAGTGRDAPTADEIVDLDGATVVPGFIDLHGHGAGGHAYDDGGAELADALLVHRAHGTTRSIVSVVTAPLAELRERLASIAALCAADPLVLGSHLEGPFLAPARRGAHDPQFLRDPDQATLESLLEAADGTLRQVTLAPELPGGLDAVRQLTDSGVIAAVGHTEADLDQTRAAFEAGARILTHVFNAMPGIHHRDPGPVVAALDDPRVTVELVLDGHHVHPDVAEVVFAAAPGRVALITDSMAAAAAPDGDYRLGSLNVTVRDGLAVLSGTSTLAGSTLTQDAALRNAVTSVGLPLADAVGALTAAPARALGLAGRLGRLEPGFAADVVVLDDDLQVTAVWAAGVRI
ncbi:MAG TPA: N-acetylglucosamine-6-phosphate deacetylase [Pseudolysinimonas sp.]|jgi:N-acetylglucosamine-6-phosphate deacetylase|nr:N-acetylglucosamine-6-phosphate deacetylase [Pseudolysinimonas sp.]